MTNEFVGTNGTSIVPFADESLQVRTKDTPVFWLLPSEVADLFQYAQEQTDKLLNRWRSKTNPYYVGYDPVGKGHYITLMDETTGDKSTFSRLYIEELQSSDQELSTLGSIAAEYFEFWDANPKPWHAAKPGEIWEIRLTNREPVRAIVTEKAGNHEWDSRLFRTANGRIEVSSEDIVDGKLVLA